MLIDLNEEFLVRAAYNGNPSALQQLYQLWGNKTDDESFHKAQEIYMEILKKFPPLKALTLLYPQKSYEEAWILNIEVEYAACVHYCADYYWIYGKLTSCAVWAQKGIDLFQRFVQKLPDEEKEQMREYSIVLNRLKFLFHQQRKYFDPNAYQKLKFEWEDDYFNL